MSCEEDVPLTWSHGTLTGSAKSSRFAFGQTVVRLAGIEPAAFRSGAERSIR